jgi:DNA primase catalytic core
MRSNEAQDNSSRAGCQRLILEAVRSQSPIVDIVSEHVHLRRSGPELVGRCPFHADRTPSLYICPAKGVFHCHGCQVGGDVFRFVQLLHNCTFRQAVEHLAARAGIEINGYKPSPELTAKVMAIQKQRDEEERFRRFCNERIDAINRTYRSLGRAATHAEDYLRSGLPADPYLHDLAWSALERMRQFENRIEREGLCDAVVIRHEWSKLRAA